MPLQQTSGNVTADAYGGGVAAVPNYIEDVFSTWLYTANNGNPLLIANNVDLTTYGGMCWIKNRSTTEDHALFDTARGFTYTSSPYLVSDSTAAQNNPGTNIARVETGGVRLGSNSSLAPINTLTYNYASWTFRKQPKFFDVVTYTGDGTSNRAIAHALGSAPGMVAVKATSTTGNWNCWHRGLSANKGIRLNLTDPEGAFAVDYFGNGSTVTTPTSTNFYVGSLNNSSGVTYVAYLFAHNAGGFGLTGTDNVISCGSYTGNGSATGPTITLGYEAQWVMVFNTAGGFNWVMEDVMRGMSQTDSQRLFPNTSAAEAALTPGIVPTATGFTIASANSGINGSGNTHIYIAIRRGPMKVPTDGTKVFEPSIYTGDGSASRVVGSLQAGDLFVLGGRSGYRGFQSRLIGVPYMFSNSTAAEANGRAYYDLQTGVRIGDGTSPYNNNAATDYLNWLFRRAPGFFDEVCWTGPSSGLTTINHNLSVAPEMIISKSRSNTSGWLVGVAQGTPNGFSDRLRLDTTAAYSANAGDYANVNSTSFQSYSYAFTWVSYLFASCPGVSKIFSFTGNGTTQTINCGFTGGARFVLLKASSATGGWYVYDTARGMTTLTDPYLFLNSTAAETATLGSVTTVTGGFAVNEAITIGVNTNAVQYIGIAIA